MLDSEANMVRIRYGRFTAFIFLEAITFFFFRSWYYLGSDWLSSLVTAIVQAFLVTLVIGVTFACCARPVEFPPPTHRSSLGDPTGRTE
jgi:hypothetical protein